MINLDYSTILSRTKLFSHPDRLKEWFWTRKTTPISAQLDTSNNCCYDCAGCAGQRFDRHAKLSEDQLYRIINEISPFVRGLEITGGGDPLTNKKTVVAIMYAQSKGMDVGLITNGQLLNEINIPILVAKTKYIRLSVDAINNSIHTLRKRSGNHHSLDIVKNNIVELVKEKQKQNSECTIGMSYLTNSNDDINTLQKFVEIAKSLGADYAQFKPYHHSNKNFIPELESLSFLNSKDFEVIFSRDKYERIKGTYKRAFADEFRTVISATGDMYPDCYTRGIKNFNFGNILRNSFEEIWNSQRRQEVFSAKLQQANCPAQCYYDPLNQILWKISLLDKSNQETLAKFAEEFTTKYAPKKEAMHNNFI